MKIIVISSLTLSLLNFRRALLEEIVASGDHDVIACGPENDPEIIEELAGMGVQFRQVPMQRASTNPISDLKTLRALHRLFRAERPDIVLSYTQKPIIYGGIAARLSRGVRFFAMQSGLGFAFSEQNTNGALRAIVAFLYRVAVRKADAVIVFNGDDRAEMEKHAILRADHKVVQVAGSGVDKARFAASEPPEGAPVFLLVARLMIDKGLYEFVEAARTVRARAPEARFQILGPFDANPASIREEDLEAWKAEGVVEYLGETRDVRPYLAAASVFVLPSFHREGLPRSILEAMATGRAIVTTHMPGCRETVIEGENGYLVPPRDGAALAEALMNFVEDPRLSARMGAVSRRLVDEKFDVRLVNDILLRTMGLRGEGAPDGLAPGGGVHDRRIDQHRGAFARRALDIAASLVGGIVLFPVGFVVAAAIAATMGRPVLFRQERGGLGGRSFRLIKFRSMTDARDASGALLSDEERITPFGRFLRRSRLDELPELWNILKGEMSLVGPRPLLATSPINVGAVGAERLSVRPGLTGWAQVNGNTLLSDDEKLALDLWYVRNVSFWLDIRILIRTVWVVIMGERKNTMELEAAYEGDPRRRG